MKSLSIFFKYSPKRQRALKTAINDVNAQRKADGTSPEIAQQKFKLLCDTCWVERHTTFEDFVDLYESLLSCLDVIIISVNQSKLWDSKSVVEANGLLKSITSSEFITAFHTNLHFLSYTKASSTRKCMRFHAVKSHSCISWCWTEFDPLFSCSIDPCLHHSSFL